MTTCKRQRCHHRVEYDGLCRSHLTAEMDTQFSIWVRLRDVFCQRCGGSLALQCSHHITRSVYQVRWDPTNAVAHCAPCHKELTEHPALHVEWVQHYMGAAAYAELLDRAYGEMDPYTGRRMQPPKVDRVATYEWLKGERV